MKKLVLLIALIFLFSCTNKEQGYNSLEKGLISTLENKDEKEIMKHFNSAAKNGNKEVFEASEVWEIIEKDRHNWIVYLNNQIINGAKYKPSRNELWTKEFPQENRGFVWKERGFVQ